MKDLWRIYLIGIVFGTSLLNTYAQVSFEQSRSADTIIYFVQNPYGNNAEFTWTITGGNIVGHSSPYTANGADTIQVIWNDSNKTTANIGSITVSEVVNWPGGSSCPSDEEKINVESWVQPKAIAEGNNLKVCSGESFILKISFEGKPGYEYKWRLYSKTDSTIVIEDYTSDFISCSDTTADIVVAGIENNSPTEEIYEFEVTDVKDGLADGMPANISMAKVNIHVQPESSPGTLKNSNTLIRR